LEQLGGYSSGRSIFTTSLTIAAMGALGVAAITVAKRAGAGFTRHRAARARDIESSASSVELRTSEVDSEVADAKAWQERLKKMRAAKDKFKEMRAAKKAAKDAAKGGLPALEGSPETVASASSAAPMGPLAA